MTRRTTIVLVAFCAALVPLAAAATPASAYTPRSYESQISTDAFAPEGIAIDSSNKVWVSENASGRISEFNLEGEKLPTVITQGSGRVSSITFDHSDNHLYEGDTLNDLIRVYDSTGQLLKSFFKEGNGLWIAVDNSAEPTAGRVYLARRHNEGGNRQTSLNRSTKTAPLSPSKAPPPTSKVTS